MGKYSVLATTSLMLNVFSFFTLILKLHKTKTTVSFNWLYLIGNVIAQILLIIYGLANNAPEIYAPTILLFVGLLYIVYIKFVYHYNDESDL
jgi:uncharacterized protein with PQ loop repeat